MIVLKNGKLVLAIGTPGGETIGQTAVPGLVNVLDFGMPMQEAIEAPRFVLDRRAELLQAGRRDHASRSNAACRPATLKALEAMGPQAGAAPEFTAGVGGMQGILVDQKKGTMTAGADPRRAGYAVGW